MAFALIKVLFLLLPVWWRMRLRRLQHIRCYRKACLKLLLIVVAWIDQDQFAAIPALLTHRLLLGTGTAQRINRVRTVAFFPEIVGTWDNKYFKENFRVSRDTFHYLCAELGTVLQREHVVKRPLSMEQCVAMTLWRLGTTVEYRTIAHLFGVGMYCCS